MGKLGKTWQKYYSWLFDNIDDKAFYEKHDNDFLENFVKVKKTNFDGSSLCKDNCLKEIKDIKKF